MTDTTTKEEIRAELGELGPQFDNPTSADQILRLARNQPSLAADQPTAHVQTPPAANNNRYRTFAGAMMGLFAVAAALVVVVIPNWTDNDQVRARGQLTMPPITLEAIIDGAKQRLSDGDHIPAGHKVVFRVTGGADGFLIMTENGTPMARTQQVAAGGVWLGGSPQAWTPDDLQQRTKTYHALWCPEEQPDKRCSTAQMQLTW